MGNKFKDGNLGTYDWIPEIMPGIDPTPKYHNKGLPDKKQEVRRRSYAEAIDRSKNALI